MLSRGFIANNERTVFTTETLNEFEQFKSSLHGSNAVIIGTHSGTFHGDEVLATLLLKYLPKAGNSVVVRTRNNAILDQCDIVCDVGGKYDATTNRYDHHMKEFNVCYDDENKIKMSSAGLIYKHLGKDIIVNILDKYGWLEQNKTHIDEIIRKLYMNFIMMVDAVDNGINAYPDNLKPKYINNTSYASRIARLNPEWNVSDVDVNERFKKAWDIAEEELYYHFVHLANGYFIAYDIVHKAVKERFNVHGSGNVIHLEQYCPWKEILFNIEKAEQIEGMIKFVLFMNQNGEYTISTVPVTLGNFAYRKGLPKLWRGLRDDVLKEKSGISDMVFVHVSGFIGAAKSYESAMKVVEVALSENDNENK